MPVVKFENHGWAEALYQALGVALMGGVGPDTIVGESFIKPYIGMNALLAMDEYVTDIRDDFRAWTEQCRRNGWQALWPGFPVQLLQPHGQL